MLRLPQGFGNVTPTAWGALCAEFEAFDRFEAAYKSTPFKPKTRVKYKGRWYRVRKRHQTTCATGLLYQLRPVGGGTQLVNKCLEKDLTPRTRNLPPPDPPEGQRRPHAAVPTVRREGVLLPAGLLAASGR